MVFLKAAVVTTDFGELRRLHWEAPALPSDPINKRDRSNTMIPRQSFEQWLQSPGQGATSTPANPLHEVEESLKSALPWLENAYALMNSNGLDKRSHRELYTAVCDAMTAVQEGCDRLDDASDEIDEIHDVALNHLPPITGIAHPPLAAF